MELRDKRDLYNGFGDGLARAFEIAVTPAVFGAVGYGLDRWLGFTPVLTIVFVVVALAGMFVRLWYGYDAQMKAHEAAGPWAHRSAGEPSRDPLGIAALGPLPHGRGPLEAPPGKPAGS